MVCPQCGTLNPDGRAACFRCQHDLTAVQRRHEVRCEHHPEEPAVAHCSVCGVGLCSACTVRIGDVVYCRACVAVSAPERATDILITPSDMGAFPHAGWLNRLMAGMVDSAVVCLAGIVLSFIFWMGTGQPVGSLTQFGANLAFWLLSAALIAVYLTLPLMLSGQTLGYAAASLIVVCEDGTTIGARAAIIRFIVSLASGFCLMLGFLSMIRDPEQRTWHDRASHTVVLRMEEQGI